MDAATINPDCKCNNLSFKKCFRIFVTFFLLTVLAIGSIILTAIFLFKPQTPVFSLQTTSLDWYKLDVDSVSSLIISSVFTMTLNAQNPNRLGIGYSPSQLHIYDNLVLIGTIRVPGFFQPPQSNNVSVSTRLLFHRVNVSEVVSKASLPYNVNSRNIVEMKISGDVKTELELIHVVLVKIKVALNCDVSVHYSNLSSLPPDSTTMSTKCALALYV